MQKICVYPNQCLKREKGIHLGSSLFFRFRLWLLCCCWRSKCHYSWMLSYCCCGLCNSCLLSDQKKEVRIRLDFCQNWDVAAPVLLSHRCQHDILMTQEIVNIHFLTLIHITWVNILKHVTEILWDTSLPNGINGKLIQLSKWMTSCTLPYNDQRGLKFSGSTPTINVFVLGPCPISVMQFLHNPADRQTEKQRNSHENTNFFG